jgi:hypothetical protein
VVVSKSPIKALSPAQHFDVPVDLVGSSTTTATTTPMQHSSPPAAAVVHSPIIEQTASTVRSGSMMMDGTAGEEYDDDLYKATKLSVWKDSTKMKFFMTVEEKIAVAESKNKIVDALLNLGKVCFMSTKFQYAICDGFTAGMVSIETERDEPTLQTYSRGLNFISLVDNIVIQRGDVFTTIDNVEGGIVKTDITFIDATAHGPTGDLKLHFWDPKRDVWTRAKWADFKRHLTRSNSLNPTLVRKENEPQVVVPRAIYMSYFSQPEINFSKQSLFFSRPTKRIQITAETQKVNDAKQIEEDIAKDSRKRANKAIRRTREASAASKTVVATNTEFSIAKDVTTPAEVHPTTTSNMTIMDRANDLLQSQLAETARVEREDAAKRKMQDQYESMLAMQCDLQKELVQLRQEAESNRKQAQEEARAELENAKALAREEANAAVTRMLVVTAWLNYVPYGLNLIVIMK